MSTATMNPRFQRNAETDRPATPPQVAQIQRVLTYIAEHDVDRARAEWRRCYLLAPYTFTAASAEIKALFVILDEVKAAKRTAPAPSVVPEIPEGRYAVDTDEGHLGFYRVRVSETGYVKVTVYASDAKHELPSWKAQLGVLHKIEVVGVKEAAIRFGRELGVCGMCGRTLTKEHSRAAGIGPTCAGQL